jgi:sulfite exporter TauE/SafE
MKKFAFSTFLLLLFVLVLSSKSTQAQQRTGVRAAGAAGGVISVYQEYQAWRHPPVAHAPTIQRSSVYRRPAPRVVPIRRSGGRCVARSCY